MTELSSRYGWSDEITAVKALIRLEALKTESFVHGRGKRKKLQGAYTGKRESKSGLESEITYYECESCERCPYKKSCTRASCLKKCPLKKCANERAQPY